MVHQLLESILTSQLLPNEIFDFQELKDSSSHREEKIEDGWKVEESVDSSDGQPLIRREFEG